MRRPLPIVGQRVELARYQLSAGERVLYGQRINADRHAAPRRHRPVPQRTFRTRTPTASSVCSCRDPGRNGPSTATAGTGPTTRHTVAFQGNAGGWSGSSCD